MSHSTNNINDVLSTPTRRGGGRPPMSRACQFCNVVLDGYQALRNHRRSCRLNYQNSGQQEDVVMEDVSNQVDQDVVSNIHGETHSDAYQDDALPDYTDDAMQMEAENSDASMVTMAPYNEDGEFYTLDANSNWDEESDNDSASIPDFHEIRNNLLNVNYKKLGIVEDNTDDLACVYDCSTLQEIDENTYTTSELISIELYDLVKDFTIPREAYRRLLYILPGKKKPASFASYLSVILAEMHYLSTYGMVVKTPDNQIIRSKVHCLAFGDDTLGKHSTGVFEISRAAYHSSSLGCRICYTRGVHPDNRSHGMCFPDSNAPLRTRQDYLDADQDLGFSCRSVLTQLDVFAGPQSLVFDELHTLGRSVLSELYQMLTVSLAPSNTKFFHYRADDGFEVEQQDEAVYPGDT
ncbi:hypothetical protein [Parasitella parasitica]|uniref:Uncharacterized protein n=1 Tax=Parasitella parasitica TaxID=35722 RepID=A0A0B7NMH8_9FUNG|nr:hypothetical protein [Parasitella parasitica]